MARQSCIGASPDATQVLGLGLGDQFINALGYQRVGASSPALLCSGHPQQLDLWQLAHSSHPQSWSATE